MLELDTLVVFGGEFTDVRRCHKAAMAAITISRRFSYMLAGGGIKPGLSYPDRGDELGYAAVDKPDLAFHDFHATMLRVLGIDHMRMTVKYSGLDARLSGVGNQGRSGHGYFGVGCFFKREGGFLAGFETPRAPRIFNRLSLANTLLIHRPGLVALRFSKGRSCQCQPLNICNSPYSRFIWMGIAAKRRPSNTQGGSTGYQLQGTWTVP